MYTMFTPTGYNTYNKSYQTTRDSLQTRKLYPAPAPLAYCKHGKLLKKHMNVTKAAVNIQNNKARYKQPHSFYLFHCSTLVPETISHCLERALPFCQR